LIIKMLALGPMFMANCFIVGCEETKQAVVIDPGDEVDKILMVLSDLKLTVKYIINTHGHFDHVGGNKKLKEVTGADLIIHKLDAPMLLHLSDFSAMFGMNVENSPPADIEVEEGYDISFGNISLKVIHTPGHSPGGISLYTDGHVFVGDTLFAGSIGRTDFPDGDMNALLKGVREKLFILDDEVMVYPGHMGTTTIGVEKKTNMFFR
jgi:hydroxyacylglutathione hydrolase